MGKGNNKEYYCCICKKKIEQKPIRLVKQIHNNKECYGKYSNVFNYDFCNGCYKTFDRWIVKHK